MKPGRKKKIPFEPVEIRVICQCLMEWRNREIQAKRHGAVDANLFRLNLLPSPACPLSEEENSG